MWGYAMVARPTWQGHLKLSLVTCPVALYNATTPGGDVHFNLINPETNNRIRMVATDPDTGPVERAALVKGYEISKGHYITLTDEEIKSVRLESTKTIDIERFVPAEEIDRLYWDHPYYLMPSGKMALEAFSVIRNAMAHEKQIALGRVVLSTRERLLALEPRGNGMVAFSLRSHDEVRDVDGAFDDIPNVKTDPDMVAIAQKLIGQKERKFDPKQITDRYEDALRALIQRKQKGQKIVVTEEPEDTNVVDLMSVLRASLGEKGARPARRSTPASPPRRRAAPAKRAARRRA